MQSQNAIYEKECIEVSYSYPRILYLVAGGCIVCQVIVRHHPNFMYQLCVVAPYPFDTRVGDVLFNVVLILIELMLIRGIGTKRDRIEILLQVPFSALLRVVYGY